MTPSPFKQTYPSPDGTALVTGCRAVVERLPWLLNGSLETSEDEAVRSHLATCEECGRELEATIETWDLVATHVPSLDLARYAQGLPVDGDVAIESIERHLASCPSCRREVEHARPEGLVDFGAEKARRRGGGGRVGSPGRKAARRWLPLAAVLALALGTALRWHLHQGSFSPPDLGRSAVGAASGSIPEAPMLSSGIVPDPARIFSESFESGLVLSATSDRPSDGEPNLSPPGAAESIFSGSFESGSMSDWSATNDWSATYRPSGAGAGSR